jgi:hypothetical protein
MASGSVDRSRENCEQAADVGVGQPPVHHSDNAEASQPTGIIGLVVFIVLWGLFVVFLARGFSFRPPEGAPPVTPATPMITVELSGAVFTHQLLFEEHLIQTRQTGFVLKVLASVSPSQSGRMAPYTLYVNGLNGYVCKPKHYQFYDGMYEIKISPRIPYTGTFLLVHLCWNRRPPLTISGSYLSAALPSIEVPGVTGTLVRGLQLSGHALGAYAFSGGIEPTAVTPRMWSWTTALSTNAGSQASNELAVAGSDTVQIQRYNSNAFLSGIFFGAAGGAALAGVAAVPGVPWRRKPRHTRTDVPASPEGGGPPDESQPSGWPSSGATPAGPAPVPTAEAASASAGGPPGPAGAPPGTSAPPVSSEQGT